MPILFSEFNDDIKAITIITKTTVNYWNSYGSENYGVRVFTHPDSIENISRLGDHVLGAFFPEEPGPFKRLATLLVLSRLEPLFYFGTLESTDDNFVDVGEATVRDWLPRLCYLMVQPVLDLLSVKRGVGLPDLRMLEWNDFPSAHSKEEFFLWLQWMRNYKNDQLHPDENLVILGRRILAASLILEAVYFQTDKRSPLCGICDHRLDLTGLIYDKVLWDNRRKDLER